MGRRFAARGVDWAAPRLRAGSREAGPGRPGLGGSGRPGGGSGKIWEQGGGSGRPGGQASSNAMASEPGAPPHPPSVYDERERERERERACYRPEFIQRRKRNLKTKQNKSNTNKTKQTFIKGIDDFRKLFRDAAS